jgi:Secretion system C-terminal sorting domain
MKRIFTLLLIPWASLCFAQRVVNTTGTSLSNANLTVEYSVGEMVTTTLTGTQQVVTQGLLQPSYAVTTETNDLFDTKFSLRCYPNPTIEELIIETDFRGFRKASIYSIDGKLVSQQVFDYQSIKVGTLSTGSYILTLTDEQNLYSKTIKIFKQ